MYEMFRTIAGRSIPRYTAARALLPLLTGMSAHCKLTVIDAIAGQGDISQDGRINRLACPATRTRQRDCQPSQTINCELIFLLADEKKYCVGRNEKCLNRQMKLGIEESFARVVATSADTADKSSSIREDR
ncbi:hypothetical protein [Burkholderia vietnamiensis]|uniref:hypothetical protein n=1 Tax=Burkholderia vietnamiensis TaxID=60552 RepID=UPI0018C543AC|nr:hypothetical protein [Burkholderia vietnamiensis]